METADVSFRLLRDLFVHLGQAFRHFESNYFEELHLGTFRFGELMSAFGPWWRSRGNGDRHNSDRMGEMEGAFFCTGKTTLTALTALCTSLLGINYSAPRLAIA